MEPITLEFTYSKEDYVQAMRRFLRLTKKMCIRDRGSTLARGTTAAPGAPLFVKACTPAPSKVPHPS